MACRILVVEDDPLISLDIERSLKQMGHDVVGTASRGEEVMELARKLAPEIVLMDINLAGQLDGIQAAAQLTKESPTAIVFLTGNDDEETLTRAAKLVRPYAYLIKPFDRNELKRTIEIVIARIGLGQEESVEEEPLIKTSGAEVGADERFSALGKIPLLNKFSSSSKFKLASTSTIKEYSAGSYLFSDRENPLVPFVPISGRLALVESSSEGKELILTLMGPGDNFGLLDFSKDFLSNRSLRAQLDSKVLLLNRACYEELVGKDEAAIIEIRRELERRLNKSFSFSLALAHVRVEARIVSALLGLIPNFGKDTFGKEEMRLFITRKELADLTGTTSETAIRTTKQLERDGFLDLTRPGIIKILDPLKLKNAFD